MELEDEKITKKDVMEIMDVFTRVPPIALKMVVNRNNNVVKSFESAIKDHFNNLTEEQIVKVKKVLDMPVQELQVILNEVYLETGQKQLKILSDPKSRDFIEGNLKELKKLLFP